MDIFNFDLLTGGIMQVAYTVADIEQRMRTFADHLKVGPWHVRGPFKQTGAIYRGAPSTTELTLALSYADHLMIELIQQHDDEPSIFKEVVEKRGFGFHHWAVGSKDFETDVARYQDAGFDLAFSSRARGFGVAMLDSTMRLPGMLEIIEMTKANEERYTKMHQASRDWDGRSLIAERK
jgi:hypothetical protein